MAARPGRTRQPSSLAWRAPYALAVGPGRLRMKTRKVPDTFYFPCMGDDPVDGGCKLGTYDINNSTRMKGALKSTPVSSRVAYRVFDAQFAELHGDAPEARLASLLTQQAADNKLKLWKQTELTREAAGEIAANEQGIINLIRMVPLGAAVDDFNSGNAGSGLLSAAGDLAFFVGGPLASTLRTYKFVRGATLATRLVPRPD